MTDYATSLIDDGFVLFLLHGVIPHQRHQVRNYNRKHLPMDDFMTFLQSVCARGTPVSLPAIVRANQNRTPLPCRAFGITFDDGFANNYTVAAPTLHAMGVPATFYITTAFVESNLPSWIDRIEFAIERTPRTNLRLPSLGIEGVFETPDEKIRLLEEIRQIVKRNRDIQPNELAFDIASQLQAESFDPDPNLDDKMTWPQVLELAHNDLFTIGGHTDTHPILTHLNSADLEREVGVNIAKLSAHLSCPIQHFSYPEGQGWCYSDAVITVLKQHGILCAPTAEPGINHVEDDLFHL